MSDQEIIGHLQQHKYHVALNGLYFLLPAVKKHIKANNGTADDAVDIFQDALVILCNKVHTDNFTLTAPLNQYLLAIVKNCWLQELRRRKKLPIGEMKDELIEEEIISDQDYLLAENAFQLLGEKCKQILILFYFKKESYKKIATLLDFSDDKIAKNQKYRCLQKAKENYLQLSNNTIHEQ
jgi:RNA polymerase sigma factor (sigma-70 family)